MNSSTQYGGGLFGGWPMATVTAPTVPSTLRPESPVIELVELVYGGYTLRVVDFYDPDGAAGAVTYEGNTYTPALMDRSDLSETLLGTAERATVTIEDPTRNIFRSLRAQGYQQDGRVTLTQIRHADLATGSSAARLVQTKTVLSFTANETRAAVSLNLGTTFDESVPRLRLDPNRCNADYHDRFNLEDDEPPLCTYPSNYMESRDVLLTTGDAVTAKRFGMRVVNGGFIGQWQTGYDASTVKRAVQFDRTLSTGWVMDDATTTAPRYYREFTDDASHDLEVDFFTSFQEGFIQKEQYFAGLYIQSVSDESDWICWGGAKLHPSGDRILRLRKTVNDVSTDTDYNNWATTLTPNAWRIKREGSTWRFYYRLESYDSDGKLSFGSWTEQTSTTLAITGDLRCGLFCASESTESASLEVWFYYLAFYAGGRTKCDQGLLTPNGCDVHGNTLQFRGIQVRPRRII